MDDQQPVQAPPPQPSSQASDEVSKRLAALEAENARHVAAQQLLTQMLAQRQQPMVAPAPVAPEPEEDIDPAVKQAVDRRTAKLKAEMDARVESELSLQRDQLDLLQYQQTLNATGVDPAVAQRAEQLYAQWRNANMRVADASGRAVAPSRIDALRFAIGNMQLDESAKVAPKRRMEELQKQMLAATGSESPGALPPGPKRMTQAEFDALPLEKRLEEGAKMFDEMERG